MPLRHPVVVLVVDLPPFVADLVEQLVTAELAQAEVVRVPADRSLPQGGVGTTVLVVTAAPAARAGEGPARPPPVTVVSLEPGTGRAASHPTAGEVIPLGELTPGLLRWLAEGPPGDARSAPRTDR